MVRLIFTIFSTSKHWNRMRSLGGGDPQEDVTGVGHPSQEEVDLGGGDGRRQAILHPQLFHRNKTTEDTHKYTELYSLFKYFQIHNQIMTRHVR